MYHLAVWWLVVKTYPEYADVGPTTFFLMSGLTVIVASLSWFGIEEPLARLKSRIPTRSVKAQTKK